MKDNLNKSLDRLKHKVADREELWLELFTNHVETMLGRDDPHDPTPALQIVAESEVLADLMLDKYESRWGKG